MNATFSALLVAASITASASTIYNDPALLNANWQSTVVSQQGATTLDFLDFDGPGNPGLFSLAVYASPAAPPGGSNSIAVVRTRPDFLWDPVNDGALSTIRMQMDVRNFDSSGFSIPVSLFYRPAIIQDGTIYVVPLSSLTVTPNGEYETLVWDFNSTSGWVGSSNISLTPNFSATGGVITFGFRVSIADTCPANATISCNEGSVFDGIDNFRVELAQASTSEVPEPGTWTLVSAAGLACFAFKKRRR